MNAIMTIRAFTVGAALSCALFTLCVVGGCASAPPAPSPQTVSDTGADFLPEGSNFQGARRLVVHVTPAELDRGGRSGTFRLTNRGKQTVVLASVVPAADHVRASSPGPMPYRVDPGATFAVTVSLNLPWKRALTDGAIARVMTTDGETIVLWLQLVTDTPNQPMGNPAVAAP